MRFTVESTVRPPLACVMTATAAAVPHEAVSTVPATGGGSHAASAMRCDPAVTEALA
jgi:hypothetical protein